jgi:glycine/D-amino acid oxidase-like deaminating enzyme
LIDLTFHVWQYRLIVIMMKNTSLGPALSRGCVWWEAANPPATRAQLVGDRTADVVIVGGGYTGTWTAYYLLQANPALSVILLEAEGIGSGASGRNGGFCSSALPISLDGLARRHGEDAAVALQRSAIDAIDQIEAVLEGEEIECNWRRGGMRAIATNEGQLKRLERTVNEHRRFGFGSADIDWESEPPVDANGVVGSVWSPHAAAVNPAQLAWGIAAAAERHGAVIYEATPVLDVGPDGVRTPRGSVRAPAVVLATEAYTANLPGRRRRILPVYSHMIATEPLGSDVWSQIGWSDGSVLSDGAREFVYTQRTHDDRIAIGGRGVSYHWRSGIDSSRETAPSASHRLVDALTSLWPALRGTAITHEWGGVLGIPRTWEPFVSRDGGVWAAGGYTGDGVLLSNLLARIVAAEIAEGDPPAGTSAIRRTAPRSWEPEPLRWIGVRTMDRLALYLDRKDSEARPNRAVGKLFDWIAEK